MTKLKQSPESLRFYRTFSLWVIPLILAATLGAQQKPETLFKEGDHVVFLGGTFASRSLYFGHIEKRLQLTFPKLQLSIRNLGWSGDEVTLQPRPLEFGTLEEHLFDQQADVIFVCFGANESFRGVAGVEKFKTDLSAFVDRLRKEPFNGKTTVRLALVSPTPHEKLKSPWPDPTERNAIIKQYADAVQEVAVEKNTVYLDLFLPLRTIMAENYHAPLTINGVHLTDEGYRIVSDIVATNFGAVNAVPDGAKELQNLIVEKNRQFFLRWRPVNAEYIFGRRKAPYGIITYPPEMAQLDKQVSELDQKIQETAATLSARAK